LSAQVINFKYLAIDRAQYASIKLGRSIDNKMRPIPWWTYPAIDYLNQYKFHDETIFEYGPGNGTLWFIGKGCKKIISVENNKKWYQILDTSKKSNQVLIYKENKDDYFNEIFKYSPTVLIIDGKWRRENLEYICSNFESLHKNLKMIIIDNPDKFKLGELISKITNNYEYVQADFFGFGPAFRGIGCTTVLLHSRNKVQKSNSIFPYI